MAGNIIDMGNGKYRLRVSNGFDLNGKRKYYNKTVSCSSRREAEKELAKFIASIEGGCTYSASKITLNEYSPMWLKTYAKPSLSPNTYQSYDEKLRLHILPYLGSKRLDKIKTLDIDNLYNFLATKPINRKDKDGNIKTLSPSTIHKVHEILSVMFNTAIKWDMVPYNPCTKVNTPKYKRIKMSCYDKETASKMLNKLFETAPLKYQCFVTLATLGGFRRGEIVGLHWDDIDCKNKTVTINRSAYYLGRQGIKEKPPKTDSSNRTIAISDTCISLLKRWRAEQGKMRLALGDRWHGVKNIFTTDDGNIMNPATGPKWFSKFLKKNNFPHIRFHDLRHTFASILVAENVDIKTVSHKLGHASTGTTYTYYVHDFESTDRASAELLEDVLIKDINMV